VVVVLRILGNIAIYGTKASLDQLISVDPIPNSILEQIGIKRKIPDKDLWCYGSPSYRFREIITLDEEVRDFLIAHERVGNVLANRDSGIEYAFFTLCPVDQSYEETFACLLSCETLRLLVNMGLSLQIAPAAIMPDVDFWK
jgi:hypothetical protein